MKTPVEIIEAHWPGWIAGHGSARPIPVLELMAEAQREALEFAAQTAELEDDGQEVARICRAAKEKIG